MSSVCDIFKRKMVELRYFKEDQNFFSVNMIIQKGLDNLKASKAAITDKSVLMTGESNERCRDEQTVSKYCGTNR